MANSISCNPALGGDGMQFGKLKRRDFITLLGGAAAAWPLAARGQFAGTLKVGMVAAGSQSSLAPNVLGFRQRLSNLGYREGNNITFEFAHATDVEDFARGYREMVARTVDILVAPGPEIALQSALAATNTLPIVMVAIDYDPIARGYVKSLPRPGGNITGIFLQQLELTAKRLQVVKDAFPELQAATVFWDELSADQWQAAQSAAPALGLRLFGSELREQPYDYEQALARAPADYRGWMFVMTSAFLFRDRARAAEFALRHRVASVFAFREWVEDGGLLSYGPNILEMFRRAA